MRKLLLILAAFGLIALSAMFAYTSDNTIANAQEVGLDDPPGDDNGVDPIGDNNGGAPPRQDDNPGVDDNGVGGNDDPPGDDNGIDPIGDDNGGTPLGQDDNPGFDDNGAGGNDDPPGDDNGGNGNDDPPGDDNGGAPPGQDDNPGFDDNGAGGNDDPPGDDNGGNGNDDPPGDDNGGNGFLPGQDDNPGNDDNGFRARKPKVKSAKFKCNKKGKCKCRREDRFRTTRDVDVYAKGKKFPRSTLVNIILVDIYVTKNRSWSSGDTLADANVELLVSNVETNEKGKFCTLIWDNPETVGEYDIWVDTNQDGVLNSGDAVNGAGGKPGFKVKN